MKPDHIIDMSRREAVMDAADCPQCGAEAGDPCTGWLNPASQALHQQRWEAEKAGKLAYVEKLESRPPISSTKWVSADIHTVVVHSPGTQPDSALAQRHGSRWSPGARAYVRFFVGDLDGAKRAARTLADAGYGVWLHPTKPREITCWESGWTICIRGQRETVRKFSPT